MPFGIDTFRNHIDLIGWSGFRTWNGATLADDGTQVGGTPLFAGRNFLGGDFIWGHAEATDAILMEPVDTVHPHGPPYPLPAGAPSPEHPENLTLYVDRVAPIQAPDVVSSRLQIPGDKGRLLGRMDADALCKRIKASILAGEFQAGEFVFVWLAVDPALDPALDLSADYWAGWSDTVNNFTLPIISQGQLLAQLRVFKACVLCSYTAGADGKLRPDPDVVAAIRRVNPGLNTVAHRFWADFRVWENAPADLLANGSALLDWTQFDPATVPDLWRFAHGFLTTKGVAVGADFDIDTMNPTANTVDSMLVVQKWQPNVPSIANVGFSHTAAVDAQANCLQNTPMPDMDDMNFRPNSGHFHVPGGPVTVVGRYIRVNPAVTMQAAEAETLSSHRISLFTIWQSPRNLAGMGLSQPHEDERVPALWGRFVNNIDKGIFYFNPDPDGNPATHDDAGTQDGHDAFNYCGNVLKQPPQTPVFFAIDFDPYDLRVPPPDPQPANPGDPPPPPLGWPALPAVAVREDNIRTYFSNIRAQRDDFATRTGRYYLIGVYCTATTLELLYKDGAASMFWQSNSTGRGGNPPPRWPWFHTNRWQYQGNVPPFCTINLTDPDADWGDGGTWILTDPLSRELVRQELRASPLGHFFPFLVDLMP